MGYWIMGISFSVLLLIIVITLLAIHYYGELAKERNKTRKAWSFIIAQFKRRVETLLELAKLAKSKNYLTEGEYLLINQNRNIFFTGSKKNIIRYQNELTSLLLEYFSNQPLLKEDSDLVSFSQQINDIESKIVSSRDFYNEAALEKNALVRKFPTRLLARIFKFETLDTYSELEITSLSAQQLFS